MPGSVDNSVAYLLIGCAMSLRMTGMTGMTAMAAMTAAADEMTLPPIGFFDYLGSMVEHEGELIDPLSLQAKMTVEQAAEAEPPAEEQLPGGRGTASNAEEVQ